MLYTRDILTNISEILPNEEYIIITGARQTGKTSLLLLIKQHLEQSGQNCHYLNLEDPEYLIPLNEHPFNIFNLIPKNTNKQTVLLDEIQYLKNPTNLLKLLYDEKRDKIRLIVSGSSAFYIDKKFKDSLVGRKFLFELHTLDFTEFLKFNEQEKLYENKTEKPTPEIKRKIEDLWSDYILYGGYPKVVLAKTYDAKQIILEDIASSYIKKDIQDAGVRNTDKYFALLKILAEQSGQLVNAQELANTLKLTNKTVEDYLYIAQKSYHVAMIKPFYKNLRKELTKMPKVYFYDIGLRNTLLKNFTAVNQRLDKGNYTENIVFREFLFKTKNIDEIKFWRTQDQKEVDFVVNKKAYEVKYSFDKSMSRYKQFQQAYPDIDFNVLTFDQLLSSFYS